MPRKAKNPPVLPPEMRTPSHGAGKLQVGNPGQRGRSVAVVREKALAAYEDRIPNIEALADGKPWTFTLPPEKKGGEPQVKWVEVSTIERLRAHELLARYGVDVRTQGVDLQDVRDRLARTLETIRNLLPPEEAIRLVDALRPIWKAA